MQSAVLSSAPLCVEKNGACVVTYVAKASSLAKALIKLLTVFPTKPPIQRLFNGCVQRRVKEFKFYFILP